jgi:hypothetical protein
MERRMSVSGGCPEWEVEAKRRLAMWRQPLSMVVHGEIVVEVVAQKGVRINVDGSGLRECMESSTFQDIQVEAARKLRKWDDNIQSAERVVYSSFLVSVAREAGVDVDGLVRLPMLRRDVQRNAGVQANLSCPKCVALERSMLEGMAGDFMTSCSFSDSEMRMEGDSRR